VISGRTPKIGIVLGYSTELQFGVLACGTDEHAFKSETLFKEGDQVTFTVNQQNTFRAENVQHLGE
jgi:hypothetical protein